MFYLFFSVSKKNCFILFMVFTTLVDANSKKTKIAEEKEQASIKLADGMGGVMSEGSLEGWKM
jgi:hypothetical protein